jgi:6-phosphofructokinase 2
MPKIVTFTPNPAIDISTSVDVLAPLRKLRCMPAQRYPGGGGINVARTVRRLGGDVTAIFPVGGPTGDLLRGLLDREHVASVTIPVLEDTREDVTVLDRSSRLQYRFVFPGSPLSEPEWRACLDLLGKLAPVPEFVVASGSLPAGVPDDLYARVARITRTLGARMILDASDQALAPALEEGVWLFKPNLRELRSLAGAPLPDEHTQRAACEAIVATGGAKAMALTLADRGALLITADEKLRARAAPVEITSTVGAGDSFLGGMVWALSEGKPLGEALAYAVAAGTAAVLNEGTELCHAPDVHRLRREVSIESMPIAEMMSPQPTR